MAAPIPIYSGFWIDRSFDSSVLGATLTLPIREANYLVTFLALLVTICASFFWTIFAFLLHQVLSGSPKVDVLNLQRQVVLRNSGTPLGALWHSVKLLLAWRKRGATKLWQRLAIIGVPALCIWTIFIIAGIFVAEVASKNFGSIPALAKEGYCGIIEVQQGTQAAIAASTRKLVQDTTAGRIYAKTWYGNETSSLNSQTLFPVTRLPYRSNNATACLWSDRCVPGPDTAFSLQTEVLESHAMFGINARKEHRITYQKKVTCSVVDVKDFQKDVNDTAGANTGDVPNWIYFYMGDTIGGNVTYYYFKELLRGGVGYVINPLYYRPGEVNVTWTPVAPFNREDSDASLFWLSQNSVEYLEPTSDPFYLANGTEPGFVGIESNNWVNVMACADQHQFCNPVNDVCLPWGGINSFIFNDTIPIGLNLSPAQVVTWYRLLLAALISNTHQSVAKLGPGALLAQEWLDGIISAGLPDNMWQLEVTRWFETSLAVMQSSIIQYVHNDVDPDGHLPVRSPSYYPDDPAGFPAAMQSQCVNQRIRASGRVQSFSVVGLWIVVCITAITGFVAATLEKSFAFLRRNHVSQRATALQADDNLHLLRMVLEEKAVDRDQDQQWWSSALGIPTCNPELSVERPLTTTNRLSSYRAGAATSGTVHYMK